jgi:RNA methyltransferase, TrmH family
LNNETLKNYIKLKQKKYRDESGQFLIEGLHLVEECLKSKFYKKNIEMIFIRKDFSDENIMNKLRGIETEILSEFDFSRLSETENPQGIIGLVNKSEHMPAQNNKIICALDNLNDPGNLGTIFRLCWWFGIDNILISRNSVDIFNSKVIRASQGAMFNLIIREKVDLPSELINLSNNNYEVLITDLKTKSTLHDYKFGKEKNYILVFGNEANGISPEIRNVQEFTKIKIDSYTNCESLNVASSAAIIFYELRKNI